MEVELRSLLSRGLVVERTKNLKKGSQDQDCERTKPLRIDAPILDESPTRADAELIQDLTGMQSRNLLEPTPMQKASTVRNTSLSCQASCSSSLPSKFTLWRPQCHQVRGTVHPPNRTCAMEYLFTYFLLKILHTNTHPLQLLFCSLLSLAFDQLNNQATPETIISESKLLHVPTFLSAFR